LLGQATTFGDSLASEQVTDQSNLRCAPFLLTAESLNSSAKPEVLKPIWDPLLAKFDVTSPQECKFFTWTIIILKDLVPVYSNDFYKAKGEARTFRAVIGTFQLEYDSRAMNWDRAWVPRVADLIQNESLPPLMHLPVISTQRNLTRTRRFL
jgi:hypothetical protein